MQAYSLQKAVSEISKEMGVDVDVEIIDYRPWRSIFYYYVRHFLKKKELFYFKKINAFSKFRKKYLNQTSKTIYMKKNLDIFKDRYDLVITGSDEVWKVGEIRGWDSNYFLSFISEASKTKKASYAVSANAAKGLDERENTIKSFLENYIGISVRDTKTKDVVKELFDIEALEVLDPTLITENNIELKDISKNLGRYILFYTTLKKIPDNIKKYAIANDLKILSVGSDIKGADGSFTNASPEQWLKLIHDADLIVTNFFHGALLSLKMNKKFISMYSGNKRFKISDVANKLNFSDKLIEQNKLKLVDVSDIDSFIISGLTTTEEFERMYKESRAYLANLIKKISD